MNGNVRDLSKYSQDDVEKLSLIEDVLEEFPLRYPIHLRNIILRMPSKMNVVWIMAVPNMLISRGRTLHA
jgi:hypothetical protein